MEWDTGFEPNFQTEFTGFTEFTGIREAMVKFEQKMKHLHNCSQLTSVLSVSSVVKSVGFKLVAYRHNECLGLELFIVKNKPPRRLLKNRI